MNAHDADPPDHEAQAPAESGPDAAVGSDAVPAKRRRAPRKKTAEVEGPPAADAVVNVAVSDGPGAAAVAETAGDMLAGPMPATEAPAGTPAEAGREGGPSRRSRRRRGRRGGDRGPRGDAAPAVEGVETVEGAGDDDDQSAAAAPAEPPAQVGEVFDELLSGTFDTARSADEGLAAALPPKRILQAEPDAPKLHKVLAQAGIGSRRDMEQMIVDGRITVNGQPAHTGQRISFGDRIAVGGKPVRVRIAPPPPRVIAYHKPAGEVVTHDDPEQRPTVFRRLPRLHQGKWQSVGRLDINTEGLLLFTNSGELANRLMHPRFGVEREYAVRSLGLLDDAARERLLEGVEIDGQRCAFKSVDDGGGEGVNHWYRVVITEGRNREVRKLFEAVGHAVSRLIRVRYGCVVLPRGLKRGIWVDLSGLDVGALQRMTQGEREGPRVGSDGGRAGGRDNDRDGESARRGRRGGRRGRGGERMGDRADGPPLPHDEHGDAAEHDDVGVIPNPLQQTFDKRAIQQARAPRREVSEDGPIPNPLQQTFDKRAMQQARTPQREVPEDGPIPNPLQQTYDKRFAPKSTGGNKSGRGGNRGGGGGGSGSGGAREPDPMRTSVGYIGADAFTRKSGGRGGGGGRGGRGGPRR